MNRRKRRPWRAWVLALALTAASVPTAAAMTLGASRPKPDGEKVERVYEVCLDAVTIGPGEERSYLTVSSDLADDPLAQDYYPGELTVELTGPITVAAGGKLNIGKLAVGGPEASPILRGELPPEGLIRVEAGGALWLNGVTPELVGGGIAIVQEPGALVELWDTPIGEELCQWSGPVADNRYAPKVELALARGDKLTAEHLPKKGRVWRSERGRSRYLFLPMEWDLSPCQGQTEGEATISGRYLDEDGTPLPALEPVEARVRWYPPEEIVLTESSWMGSTAASARLGYRALPEEATELWGELSRDGGESWERWEECDFDATGDHLTCTFLLSDAVPRQYRLAATDEAGSQFWRSEAVELPKEESDDQGGNRGGSTDPLPPSREPEPVEEDDPAATPAPSPTPSAEPTPIPAPESRETPPAEPTPEPTALPLPEEVAVQEVTLPPPPLAPEPVPSAVPETEAPAAVPAPTETPAKPEAAVKPLAAGESGPKPAAAPTATPSKPTAVPAATSPEPAAAPTETPSKPTAAPTASPEPTSAPAETPSEPSPTPRAEGSAPEAPRGSPPALQAALVLAGLGLCAAVGAAVAWLGNHKRR